MDWQEEIQKAVETHQRVVVLGVGNEMMGDDAAGVAVARVLKSKIENLKSDITVAVIDGGTTPENFTGPIRRMAPGLVIIVDSADMGRPAGEIALLDPGRMHSLMHSTHTMPLSFLAGYLERTSGARVMAVGIQAVRIDLGIPMDPAVADSVAKVSEGLRQALECQPPR